MSVKNFNGKFSFFFLLSLCFCFFIFFHINSLYSAKPISAKLNSDYQYYVGLKGVHTSSSFWVLSNSNGAFTPLYRGEKKNGAFFGGCNFLDNNSYKDQISKKLSDFMGDVFIENFSEPGLYCRPLVQKLKKINKKYDYIFISSQCLRDEFWNEETFLSFKKYKYYFMDEFKNRMKNLKREIFSKSKKNESKKKKKIVKFNIPDPFPEFDAYDFRIKRFYRNLGKVKFYSQDIIPSEVILVQMIEAARKMFKETLRYSDKVYFITNAIAYGKDELPGVSKRWQLLFSVNDWKYHSSVEKDLFLDNQSYARFIRKSNKLLSRVAREYGIKIIDLDSYLKKHLNKREDLFYDRQHLTPKGVKLAAEYIYSEM